MMDDSSSNARLVVYGHRLCGLALKLEDTLNKRGIDFEWRDVRGRSDRGGPRFADELRRLAGGHCSVPTIIFPDGAVLIEPSPEDVLRRLHWGPLAGIVWLLGLA